MQYSAKVAIWLSLPKRSMFSCKIAIISMVLLLNAWANVYLKISIYTALRKITNLPKQSTEELLLLFNQITPSSSLNASAFHPQGSRTNLNA